MVPGVIEDRGEERGAVQVKLPTTIAVVCGLLLCSGLRADDATLRLPDAEAFAIDEFFVIEADTPVKILMKPNAVLSVVKLDGPVLMRGRFAGGERQVETRSFAGSIYSIEAKQPGEADIIILPDDGEPVWRTLVVSGQGPNPPPDPDVPDPPGPPGPATSFRVIFVKESGQTLNAAQTAIPGSKEIRDYLNRKVTKDGGIVAWREYDPQQVTTNEQPVMKTLWETVKPKIDRVPALVIEVNGKATVMDFPKDVADCMATLKRYGGSE